MIGEAASDLIRLVVAILVVWGGARTLRWLEARRPAGANRDRTAVHRLWFLAPSLVMSILVHGYWWRSSLLPDLPLILFLPGVALVLGFEGLRRLGFASDHPVALALGNAASVAALVGFVLTLGSSGRPSWGLFAAPQTAAETLRWTTAILLVGCGAFLLPCVLVERVRDSRKRPAG